MKIKMSLLSVALIVFLSSCAGMTVTVPYKGIDYTVSTKTSAKGVAESPVPVEAQAENSYLETLFSFLIRFIESIKY